MGNFTLSNSIISVKDLIRWKRGFEIFLIDHYPGDIGNKSLISIKKSLYQSDAHYTRQVSSYRVLYLKFVSLYNICIIYLHIIETYLKVTIAMFYFCNLINPSDLMKKIFDSISVYSSKQISLSTNIRNKGVIGKINLHFLTSWKMAIFFLQKFVIFNMMTDSFLVDKWRTLGGGTSEKTY